MIRKQEGMVERLGEMKKGTRERIEKGSREGIERETKKIRPCDVAIVSSSPQGGAQASKFVQAYRMHY